MALGSYALFVSYPFSEVLIRFLLILDPIVFFCKGRDKR